MPSRHFLVKRAPYCWRRQSEQWRASPLPLSSAAYPRDFIWSGTTDCPYGAKVFFPKVVRQGSGKGFSSWRVCTNAVSLTPNDLGAQTNLPAPRRADE